MKTKILTILALASVFAGGCSYKGVKVVEGTDLIVGINVPVSEGSAQFQLMNYLSGFRLGVDRNAKLKVKYIVAETNTYFGVIQTSTSKSVDAKVEPSEKDNSSPQHAHPPDAKDERT
jgi:hypothetical protein